MPGWFVSFPLLPPAFPYTQAVFYVAALQFVHYRWWTKPRQLSQNRSYPNSGHWCGLGWRGLSCKLLYAQCWGLPAWQLRWPRCFGAPWLRPLGTGIPVSPSTEGISFCLDQTDLIEAGHRVSCCFLQFSSASTRNKGVSESRCNRLQGCEAFWVTWQYVPRVNIKGGSGSKAGMVVCPGKGKEKWSQLVG